LSWPLFLYRAANTTTATATAAAASTRDYRHMDDKMALPPSGEATSSVMCQLVSAEGENLGAAVYLPQNVGPPQLQDIVNQLLHNVRKP
jgi:ribosome assembly protein 4